MSIPQNITKEHLLAAISKIDKEGIPKYGDSQYYDVLFKGKRYPPKLVVSYANIYANESELDRNSFEGGLNTPSFKLLTENGFVIEKKSPVDIHQGRFWIEKTIVHGREDRNLGDRALGKALWSPQRDKAGSDIYKNMRLVEEGDIILHLIDNQYFAGISIVSKKYIETTGLVGTPWDSPSYLIELNNYTELNPKIDRKEILKEENRTLLKAMADKTEVFYNNKLDFRQGAYLTPCPLELLQLINETYKKLSSLNLPFIENIAIENSHNETMTQFDIEYVNQSFIKASLKANDKLVLRFTASLLTKPFVILTGLSGSGKTKLAQAFAMWICENKTNYCIVPVGADWTNRDPLLGFPNSLTVEEYVKPENRVLDMLIDANKIENLNKPYFLILDEMNLSHVERYFADFLSVMESKNKISLHPGQDWNEVPSEIELPNNLFIIGTVNIDETTYMFSPKVLDRANVIEFRVTEKEMQTYLEGNTTLDLTYLEGLGSSMGKSFVEIAKDHRYLAKDKNELAKTLITFFSELKKAGAEFGYRSASEILRFAAVVNKIDPIWNTRDIIDVAIMQKLLPKVHGSRRKLEPILKTLGSLCLQNHQNFDDILISKMDIDFTDDSKIKYPISLEKILRMYDNLISNGFTSYAEA